MIPLPGRRAALIHNPAAGRRGSSDRLAAIVAALAAGGLTAEPVATAGPGDATGLARQLAGRGGLAAVIALGGDGTVREVAAGLLGTGVALGILPGGTVNLLAHALGLPREPVAAAALLGGLEARPLDVGLAGDTPFLMMVSAGLDASLLAGLDLGLKRRFGRLGIAGQGLALWWRYAYPDLAVTAGGQHLAATFAIVANIPFYAGPYRLVPQADPGDGRLDLLLFRGRGRRATLGFACDVLRGAHLSRPDVSAAAVAGEIVLAGPAEAAVQVDGDLCRETLPLRIRLAAERLTVLAPPAPLTPSALCASVPPGHRETV